MYKLLRTLFFYSSVFGLFDVVLLQGYGDGVFKNSALTEHPGGTIVGDKLVFSKSKSPYWLRNDIIIERNAEVIIEPGVQIKFERQVGITVRGVLTAVGTPNEPIVLTSAEENLAKTLAIPEIRLVDGSSILEGRLQIKHNGAWRSVCTNSKNWTIADMETACRQLGFQGGSFFNWFNRQMPLKPRLLYERPSCTGTETSLKDCRWESRQMGSGVCDYHPDIAIRCLPRHDQSLPFWRGVRFEDAKFETVLTASNTLYVPTSSSKLKFVQIRYAGVGREHNTTSAVHVEGVPPALVNVEVVNSAFNGLNISNPQAPFYMNECTVRGNRGHGVYINSTYGLATINNCVINENGGDGVRYIHSEERPDERLDKSGYHDFCTLAITSSQAFPIQVYAEQNLYAVRDKVCTNMFATRFGKVITIHFIKAITDRNESATIEIYDGSSFNHRLLTQFPIRNNTKPQSVTSTFSQIFIKFIAKPKTNMVIFMRLVADSQKSYDLKIGNSDVSANLGRGIAVDEMRSQVYVYNSSVSKNEHVAGLHVTSGVGDVNVTDSKISFNEGDGINITYTGGARNISRSIISSNVGYGVAIWLNQTKETEFIFVNQTSVLQYSEIYKNLHTGVLHGNFCGPSFFNFTGNKFRNSLGDALEILTCWVPTKVPTKLQIGHNMFHANERIGLRITPAVNLDATIEFNHFRQGTFGGLLIKNKPLEEFTILASDILVQQNYFMNNTGMYVVNIGLSPYSTVQRMLFTRNFVKNNKVSEPFQPLDGSVSNLIPRSRVAAPVVVGSSNVDIFRNILENPDSKYEIGSHLVDQSKTINCTFNWLGYSTDDKIFHRIFHRYDRYNLAKIIFYPFLLHNSNPLTNKYNAYQLYVPKFYAPYSDKVGGEIEGEEILTKGEYVVDKDINIRPGGKLTLEPGVTLRFPPSIGMMVGGKLEARGIEPDSIRLTLKEEISHPLDNATYEIETERYEFATEIISIEDKRPIRLLGGTSETMGRLQVRINNEWGTVCDYGWTRENAALVCQQLGFVLNPDDWRMERNEIPDAGTTERVLVTNVQCDDFDLDITKCRFEYVTSFENSCTHDNDVGVKCYKTSWAGVRFSGVAERSNIQYVTIEQSGLLDYATTSFKPALQLDFSRQNFENIKISNNYYDGFGVVYSDIYTDDSINIIKNSEFSNNRGAGMSFKQLGFNIFASTIEGNQIGIRHDPVISSLQQREIAGWFTNKEEGVFYNPMEIPFTSDQVVIEIKHGETKFMVTTKVENQNIQRTYNIRCDPGWVIGIQLINPIENRSTEHIEIKDSLSYSPTSDLWVLNRDLTIFPTTSSAPGIIMKYFSGPNALGGAVIVLSAIHAPFQNVYNRIVKGPVPTLTVSRTKIRSNNVGIQAFYYNRYLNELGDHFLRKANETFKFLNCEISHNRREALYVESPHWDLHTSNISEIKFMLNNSLITDNGKGFYQFSRDMRQSNNLFHYVLQDDTLERNKDGGFDIRLPYVWEYNENFTHSVYMDNNTWSNNRQFLLSIDGHFAEVNLTRNRFNYNQCKNGLLSIKGMEKKLLIKENKFNNNDGKFVVEFSSNSQSEIIGEVPAKFTYNELRNNKYTSTQNRYFSNQLEEPTCVVAFRGIQKVKVNRNLFSDNELNYQLIAGIRTAKINNFLDVRENWWGTNTEEEIKRRIFDFNDWNNHAIAQFRPFLMTNDFESSISVSFSSNPSVISDNLGGQLFTNVTLHSRPLPYIVTSDITVMPNAVLIIYPGVILEFAPNVGILVLGTLLAQGYKGNEIIMRPITQPGNIYTNQIEEKPSRRQKRQKERLFGESIRLCSSLSCDDGEGNEGFLEYFNKTTYQWIPICDPRFTERNAQVVCRELGFDPLFAFFDRDIRIEFHSNSLSRIWSWPEPLQCKGTESKYEDCPIRLNGQQYGHRHRCKWNSKFVFINCGDRSVYRKNNYWGGIRFADSEFEQKLYTHRLHDVTTHSNQQDRESILEFVKIDGAGILHLEKSPSVQSIIKSPKVQYVTITNSACHGINLISPAKTMNLIHNSIENSLGVGINILSLTGEGRESQVSSFKALKGLNNPYHLFSLIDICDPHKEIRIEERVIIYYKYDNQPVNCIKIFKSAYNIKRLGFRMLQFNLFNSTNKYTIPDFIKLYDGDIFNVTSKLVAYITTDTHNEDKFFTTKLPSMSVKLFANGAPSAYGFFAEVVTLPISAIGFNRDVQHNISYSVINNNREGGLLYNSVGEINPIITIEKNQFKGNCKKLYGNFTTCHAAIDMDVQNTQTIFFRNNLVADNQGGLSIKSDSSGSATALKGYVENNLFVNNTHLPALYIEGRQSSPYQEVILKRNYFTRNFAEYSTNIVLRQVISTFTHNYVKRNVGLQNLEISGFDKVRLPIFQTTSHNGFYNNYALFRDGRSTIVAGTAGQQYIDNIFFNPDNDYEMITVNRSLFEFNSTLQQWNTKIDATSNYWGVNATLAVHGRIRDQSDDPRLLEVNYRPYLMNNLTVLNDDKCPPGWNLVGQTCYMYIGAPMTFHDAKAFCQADNASMPYLLGNINYLPLYEFLKKQHQWYLYSDKVWIQHIDRIGDCTMFAYQSVEEADCLQRNPFICEIDPKVSIRILPLTDDIVTIAVISSAGLALLLIILVVGCWWHKNKFRQAQRLERRNSIRASLHSLKSVGLAPSSLSEASYRRKFGQMSTRSTDTLTKNSDYKKVISNGSLDSMEKSVYNSSLEDNQSYDIYEAHNPNHTTFGYNPAPTIEYHKSPSKFQNQYASPTFDLAFKNEGFRDNSTVASTSNFQSRAQSVEESSMDDETPIIQSESRSHNTSYPPSEYYNSDTLPIDKTLHKPEPLHSNLDSNNYPKTFDPSYSRERPNSGLVQELKNKFLMELPQPPDPPETYSPSYSEKIGDMGFTPDYNTVGLAPYPDRPHSANLLETDFGHTEPPTGRVKPRAKSEALLETNFDFEPAEHPQLNQPLTDYSRSKSQPLETAM